MARVLGVVALLVLSGFYGVHATPTAFVIGRDGRLLGRAVGPRPWTEPAGRALLDSVLRR